MKYLTVIQPVCFYRKKVKRMVDSNYKILGTISISISSSRVVCVLSKPPRHTVVISMISHAAAAVCLTARDNILRMRCPPLAWLQCHTAPRGFTY